MAVKKEKPPVKYYEIVDKKPSGFIMDGTGGTQYQQELTTPSIQWIAAQGKTCVKVKDEKSGVETKHFVEIRYINGCDSIFPEEQEKRGFVPKRLMDKIPIENGFVTVERDGSTIGLYDYMEKAFWNQDNPDRPDTAASRYREVKMNEKARELLDDDEMVTEAKSIVYSLRKNTGGKTPYKYDEDRIDSICRLVGVWDQSPETKLIKLLQEATQNPKQFLEIVVKAEQTIITEISHALEMKVISFDGNTAQYSEGNKIIVALGGERMKEDVKIDKLAAWLGTQEGNPSLTELRAKLELAKEKEFGSPK
jgi:hypothetical protein